MNIKNMSYEAKELEEFLTFFFSNQIEELNVKFSKPYIISKEEYREIFSNYDGSNGAVNNDVYMDQFTYDESFIEEEKEVKVLAKINVWYTVFEKDDMEFVEIHEIYGWREKLGGE